MWQDARATHRYFSVISTMLLVCVLPEIGVLALIPKPSHGAPNETDDTLHGSSLSTSTVHDAPKDSSNHEETPPVLSHDTSQKTKNDHGNVTRHATGPKPPYRVKKKKHDTGFSFDPKEEEHEAHHGNDHVEPEELEMEERERRIIFGNHQSFAFHDDRQKNAGVVSTLKKPVAMVWGELRVKNI